MLGILSFLKSGRIIAIILAVLVLVGCGWYVSTLIDERDNLELQVSRLTSNNASLQEEMSRMEQQHENEVKALNTSLNTYMSSLAMLKQTEQMLKDDLNEVAEHDEELEACLNRNLPDNVIQRLLN